MPIQCPFAMIALDRMQNSPLTYVWHLGCHLTILSQKSAWSLAFSLLSHWAIRQFSLRMSNVPADLYNFASLCLSGGGVCMQMVILLELYPGIFVVEPPCVGNKCFSNVARSTVFDPGDVTVHELSSQVNFVTPCFEARHAMINLTDVSWRLRYFCATKLRWFLGDFISCCVCSPVLSSFNGTCGIHFISTFSRLTCILCVAFHLIEWDSTTELVAAWVLLVSHSTHEMSCCPFRQHSVHMVHNAICIVCHWH